MKKKYKIGVIPGDGIGRDVIKAAQIVLETVNEVSKEFSLEFHKMETGDAAVAKYGDPFPKETVEGIKQTNAVLFGAAGNPNTTKVLMGFRLGFSLYAGVRPIKALRGSGALRPKADLIIVGTHGRRGLPRFFLGSVAERVVATAPCPVVTVRAK